jgi:hypothetical protein
MGGQAGLATPLVWALWIAGLVVAVRRAWVYLDPRWSLLVALSLPAIVVFLQHAIGDRVQGNWPAIVYPALTVAAGGAAIRRRWWIGASALGFAITGLTYAQALSSLIPLPKRLDPIAMRLAGWDGLARQVEAVRTGAGAEFVAADGYGIESEMAWWMPSSVEVVGTDARWRLLALPQAEIGGRVGLLIEPAGRSPEIGAWDQAERIGTADRPGSGTGDLVLYRVTPRRDSGAVALPCRCDERKRGSNRAPQLPGG